MNAGEMKTSELKHFYFYLETDKSDGEHKEKFTVSQTVCETEFREWLFTDAH